MNLACVLMAAIWMGFWDSKTSDSTAPAIAEQRVTATNEPKSKKQGDSKALQGGAGAQWGHIEMDAEHEIKRQQGIHQNAEGIGDPSQRNQSHGPQTLQECLNELREILREARSRDQEFADARSPTLPTPAASLDENPWVILVFGMVLGAALLKFVQLLRRRPQQ